MLKLFAFLKAKAGMSREAFVKRYEEGHVPLIERLIPVHSHYRRNFIKADGVVSLGHLDAGASPPFFDVLTEVIYENEAKLAELTERLGKDGTGDAVAADEADFLDRSQMLMLSVDERETPAALLQPRPAGHDGPPAVKQIALLRKKQGMSREAFIDYYEQRHSNLANRILLKNGRSVFAFYKRNYPIPGGRFDMPHVPGAGPEFDYDCISEFWFWREEDYTDFLDLCSQPGIAVALEQDELQFFDRSAICVLMVEEHVTR